MLEYRKDGERMEKEKLQKNDILLIAGIIMIAVISLVIQFLMPDSTGKLIIQIDGERIATYPLEEDREFEINDGTNRVKIYDGKVQMIRADCPDQICVHHKSISRNHETIVCLPHKIVLIIESEKKSEVDATTN